MHTRSQDRQDKLSAIMELGGLRSNKKGEEATPAKPEPAQSNDHQMDDNAAAPTPVKQKSKAELLKQKMKLLQKKKKEQQVQSSHQKIQKAEGQRQSKIIDQTLKEPGYEQSIKATQLPAKIQPQPKKDEQPKKGKDLLAAYLSKVRKSKEQSESSKKEQPTPDNKIVNEEHKNAEPLQPAQFVEKQGEPMEPERQEEVVKSNDHGQEEIVKPSEGIDQEKEKAKLLAEEARRQMQMQRQRRQREVQRQREQQEQARREKEKQAQATRLQLLTELSTKQSQRLKQKTKQQNIRKLQAQLQQLKEERAKSKPVQSQLQPAPVPVPVPTQPLQDRKDSKQVQEQEQEANDEIEVQQDQVQYEDEGEEEEEEVWKDGKRVPHQESKEVVQRYEQYCWQKHPLVCHQPDTLECDGGEKKLKIRQKIVLKQIFKLRNCMNKFNPSSKPTPQLKPSQFATLVRQHISTLSQLIHPI